MWETDVVNKWIQVIGFTNYYFSEVVLWLCNKFHILDYIKNYKIVKTVIKAMDAACIISISVKMKGMSMCGLTRV